MAIPACCEALWASFDNYCDCIIIEGPFKSRAL